MASLGSNELNGMNPAGTRPIPHVYMMTSSNGNIFCVTGHLCGNSPVSGEFPAQRPVTWSFDVFFDLRLNKRLGKQSWGWWFETPSRPLWRHWRLSDGNEVTYVTISLCRGTHVSLVIICWSLLLHVAIKTLLTCVDYNWQISFIDYDKQNQT